MNESDAKNTKWEKYSTVFGPKKIPQKNSM